MTTAVAGAAALVLLLVTIRRPTAGVAAWVAVLVLVPHWTPMGPAGVRPVALAGVAVLIGVLASRHRVRVTWSVADSALVLAGAVVAIFVAFGGYPTSLVANVVGVLLVSYALGRLAPQAAGTAFAVTMVGVALWGIVEFTTGWYAFAEWMTSAPGYVDGNSDRGGVLRSLGAFGHPIAYGAAVALAIPFALRFRRFAAVSVVVLVAGVATSLSRGPLLAAALAVVLAVVVTSRRERKQGTLLVLVLAGVGVAIVLQFIYGADDRSTLDRSTDTRLDQLAATVPHLRAFGSERIGVEDGQLVTAGSDVIDNTLLRLSVNYGVVVAILLLAAVLLVIGKAVRGRWTPASVAVVAQLPVLATASLITQWQAALFFVSGMAVTSLARARTPGRGRAPARVNSDGVNPARPNPARPNPARVNPARPNPARAALASGGPR